MSLTVSKLLTQNLLVVISKRIVRITLNTISLQTLVELHMDSFCVTGDISPIRNTSIDICP